MGNQWNKIYKDKLTKYNYYNLLQPHEDLSKFINLLKKNNCKDILELGSGSGRNLVYLCEQGFNLSGIDSSVEGIKITDEILESKNLSANLKVGNILHKLPYNDNSFDAIISTQLHHGFEQEIVNTINEIKRILKPNGLIFITLPLRFANRKIRPIIVKTAKKVAPNTYVPTIGDETGLIHFIYNQTLIKKHYKDFNILENWQDNRDYFCFIAQLN